MGRKITALKLLLIVLGILLIGYVGKRISYRYLVNTDVANMTKNLIFLPPTQKDVLSGNIYFDYRDSITWGKRQLRITNIQLHKNYVSAETSEDVLSISDDEGLSWREIAKLPGYACSSIVVRRSDLVCVDKSYNQWVIRVIDEQGNIIKEKVINASRALGLISLVSQGNELYIVWNDERSRFLKPLAFLKPFSSDDSYFGSYLTIVGILNLDTLEFKEHIIQYGSEWFCYEPGRCVR